MTASALRFETITGSLPAGLDVLQVAARSEGFRFVDRLPEEWASGRNRFDRPGERLLAAFLDDALCGIGGLTQEPSFPGALRMRRFYVLPAVRGRGIARHLVAALFASVSGKDVLVTVNAGTSAAPTFWERAGFVRVNGDGLTYTHVLRRFQARS